jgi:hypothetical protein
LKHTRRLSSQLPAMLRPVARKSRKEKIRTVPEHANMTNDKNSGGKWSMASDREVTPSLSVMVLAGRAAIPFASLGILEPRFEVLCVDTMVFPFYCRQL